MQKDFSHETVEQHRSHDGSLRSRASSGRFGNGGRGGGSYFHRLTRSKAGEQQNTNISMNSKRVRSSPDQGDSFIVAHSRYSYPKQNNGHNPASVKARVASKPKIFHAVKSYARKTEYVLSNVRNAETGRMAVSEREAVEHSKDIKATLNNLKPSTNNSSQRTAHVDHGTSTYTSHHRGGGSTTISTSTQRSARNVLSQLFRRRSIMTDRILLARRHTAESNERYKALRRAQQETEKRKNDAVQDKLVSPFTRRVYVPGHGFTHPGHSLNIGENLFVHQNGGVDSNSSTGGLHELLNIGALIPVLPEPTAPSPPHKDTHEMKESPFDGKIIEKGSCDDLLTPSMFSSDLAENVKETWDEGTENRKQVPSAPPIKKKKKKDVMDIFADY